MGTTDAPVGAKAPALHDPSKVPAPHDPAGAGARQSPRPREGRAAIVRVLALALTVRLVLAAAGFFAAIIFPIHPDTPPVGPEAGEPFRDTFVRWDSDWYLDIARNGYVYVPDQPNRLAFFPLYPLTVRVAGTIALLPPERLYLAGIFVSWVAFAGAMVLLFRLARLDLDERQAQRATIYAAVFPFAFFFGSVYTESLFLLLTLGAFYGFRTRRWLLGSASGALASATRLNGIFSAAALALVAWQTTRGDRRQQVLAACALAGVSLGLVAYSTYVYLLSGSPLEWMSSIRRWEYDVGGAPWLPLIALARQLVRNPYTFLTASPNGPYDTLNGLTAMLLLASIPFVWRRLGAGYGVFMLVNLAVPLSSGHLVGLGRYCVVLFPFFIWLATFRSETLHHGVVIGFAMASALGMAMFVNLHPVY